MRRSKAQLRAISRSYTEKRQRERAQNPPKKKVVLSTEERKALRQKDIAKYGSRENAMKHYSNHYNKAVAKERKKEAAKEEARKVYSNLWYEGYGLKTRNQNDPAYKEELRKASEKYQKASSEQSKAYLEIVRSQKPNHWWNKIVSKNR